MGKGNPTENGIGALAKRLSAVAEGGQLGHVASQANVKPGLLSAIANGESGATKLGKQKRAAVTRVLDGMHNDRS